MIDLRPRNDPKRLMDEAKDWAATCRQQEERIERLRAALQNIRALAAKRQHEGGPDGNLKTIEEFAVYGLEGKNP